MFIIVAGHADLSRFIGRAKGFLMEQAGLFPKSAFSGEDADGESCGGVEGGEVLDDVGLDGFRLVGPVIRAGAQFDFHHGTDITDGSGIKRGGIVKQQALAIGHVPLTHPVI